MLEWQLENQNHQQQPKDPATPLRMRSAHRLGTSDAGGWSACQWEQRQGNKWQTYTLHRK